MKINRNVVSKAICLSALCCILASNVCYADCVQPCISEQEKLVASFNAKHDTYTNEYADTLYQIINHYENCGDYKTALVYALKLKEAYINLNNAEETGYADLKIKHIYNALREADNELKYSKEAEKYVLKNPDNKKFETFQKAGESYYYSNYEQHCNALNIILDILANAKTDKEKIFWYHQAAIAYDGIKDYDNVEKALKNELSLIKNDPKQLLEYYNLKISTLIDRADYTGIPDIEKKALELINNTENNKQQAIFDNNLILSLYYREIYYTDQLKTVAQENIQLAKELNNKRLEYIANDYIIDYYSELKEFELQKQAIDKKEKLFKELFNKGSVEEALLNEKYIDYYKDTKNYTKAYNIAKKSIEILEPNKDIIPVIYGNALKKKAESAKELKKFDEALQAAKDAKVYYAKADYPEISFKIFEVEKVEGDIYKEMKDYDKAIASYDKAEDTLYKVLKDKNKENYEINKNLANIYIYHKNDLNKAIQILDESIEIIKNKFGENHIKIQELKLKKAKAYVHFNQYDIADNIICDIKKSLDAGVDGYMVEFYFDYNFHLANKYLNTGEYEKALKYADEAAKYAKEKNQTEKLNCIYSCIYKNLNKPFKALKYKIKEKI